MENKKEDRRTKYTKMVLREALIDLMKEQHVSKVTVKELCARADINRSTFYAHYHDQYDLLQQLEQGVLADLKDYLRDQNPAGADGDFQKTLVGICSYAKKNAALFEVLLSDNCDISFQNDVVAISRFMNLGYSADLDPRLFSYLEAMSAEGAISAVKKWLHDGTPESSEYMAELIIRFLFKGALSFSQESQQ